MSAVRAEGLKARYGRREVLHGLDFAVAAGASLGVVGESGSGKSTLGRAIASLVRPSGGAVLIDEKPAAAAKSVQLIFQNPAGALNPRRSCGASVAEALRPRFGSRSAEADIRSWFELVGLDPGLMARRPAQLSGGQKQRVAIARALAARPRVLVADEITSALDLSVQASILNLLRGLRKRFGFTLVFISHDLPVVRYLCDEIAVMCGGRIVECGPAEVIARTPAHPYTRALFDAVPRLTVPPTAQTCEVS